MNTDCLFDGMRAGAVGVIWAVMWVFLVYNSPAAHPRISVEEREYIEKALNLKAGDKVCRPKILRRNLNIF